MDSTIATPAFHGKLRTPEFYANITRIIRAGGRITRLRTHAERLNALGLTTPSGLPWTKERVRNFIRNTNLTYF